MKTKELLKFASIFESLAEDHYGLVPTDEEINGSYRRPAIPKFKRGDLVKWMYEPNKFFVFLSYKHWRDNEEYQSNPEDYEEDTIHPDLKGLITEVKKVKTPDGRTKLVPVGKLFQTSWDSVNKKFNDRYSFITVNVKELDLIK